VTPSTVNPVLPVAAKRGLGALASLGVLITVLGLVKDIPGFWGAFLMSFYLLVGAGLSGLLFFSINRAASARWDTQIRRVPEAMAATLAVSGALVLVLLWGGPKFYSWAQPGALDTPELLGKKFYFSPLFYNLRSIIAVAGWVLLSRIILGHSRKRDQDGLASHGAASKKWSILFLLFFAYSFSLMAVDWLGSLQPTWYSTILGLYCFAGLMQSGLATIILLVLFLEKAGVLQGRIRDEHRQDLGKWLFAWSAFWAYMWFAQFMLIWYSDQPDENQFYLLRGGAWAYMIGLTVLGRFCVPFFGIASQAAKRNTKALAGVAAVVLLSHWLDIFVLVMPTQTQGFSINPLAVILPVCAAAEFVLLFFAAFGRRAAVPENEPALAFSQHYHL
jgi:hypothetical protein